MPLPIAGFASVLLLAVFFTPATAWAHDDNGDAGGFVTGLLHPVSGIDHLLAMVAVGVWGAFLGKPLIYVLPIVFPVMMTVGGATGIIGLALPAFELGIAVSVLTLGLMIMLAVRAPPLMAYAVVAIFAVFHGYAHGTELPAATDPIGYTSGFVLTTGLLHLAGIALGSLKRIPGGAVALRAAGGVTAASGLWFVWAALDA